MRTTLGASLSFVLLMLSCNDDKEQTGFSFQKETNPVWEGALTAADPDVIRDGDTLRMYYSSLVVDGHEKLVLAGAKSVDGKNWVPADKNLLGKESITLDANPGKWDNHLEANAVILDGGAVKMFYCGYEEEADVAGTIVAEGQIGLAESIDKTHFTRNSSDPILALGTTNAKDANALFSPTVLKEGGTYYMLYVGYCIEDCSPAFIGILAATSPDGITWTKLPDPVLTGADKNLAWAEVIKEPDLVKGPDGLFYLFISGDHSIGIARSANILGPYEVHPDPIIEPTLSWEGSNVIAPSVIIENNKVRVWYMGVTVNGSSADFAVGYAEAEFPLKW
jgi:beta-xylosidase